MSTSSFPPPVPPPQFGSPVFPPNAPSTTTSGQVLMSSTPPVSTRSGPSPPCCDSGRPILTDPHTGQTVCSCQYSPPVSGAAAAGGLLAAAAAAGGLPASAPYPRIPGLPEGFYNSPYAAAAAAAAAAASQGFMPLSADPSAFYPAMGTYDLKTLAASSPMYAYDPTMGAYPYPNGFLDPNARRKNATRESTQTLKAWLSEHKKNPYPTKGEKIMLAIITKMTLTQVSTWFANARRRLKKENKMTWEPRNRADDEDDDDEKMDSDSERPDIRRGVEDDDDMEEIDIGTESEPEDASRHISDSRRLMDNLATSHALHSLAAAAAASHGSNSSVIAPTGAPHPFQPRSSTPASPSSQPPSSPASDVFHTSDNHNTSAKDSFSNLSNNSSSSSSSSNNNNNNTTDSVLSSSSAAAVTTTPSTPSSKPKIWSMADIATSASRTSSSASSPPLPPPPAVAAAPLPPRPRSPPRMPLHARPMPGFPYSWPGLPYGLPPHLMPQVSTAALLSRYGLGACTTPMMVSTGTPTSAFCRPLPSIPGVERRELHAGLKSSSPIESAASAPTSTGQAPPPPPSQFQAPQLHTAFRPVPKSKPTQPIHV